MSSGPSRGGHPERSDPDQPKSGSSRGSQVTPPRPAETKRADPDCNRTSGGERYDAANRLLSDATATYDYDRSGG